MIALAGRVEHMESLALGVRCKVGTIHTMDLGLNLWAFYKSTSLQDLNEIELRKRVASWNR